MSQIHTELELDTNRNFVQARRLILSGALLALVALTFGVGVATGVDPLALLVGMLLGVLASLPGAGVVLTISRRPEPTTPVAVAVDEVQPQPEHTTPTAAWPASFVAFGLNGDEEETFDDERFFWGGA